MPDAHANFAISAVATAPSPAASGTSLVVTTGHGTRFPTPPFNATIWPASSQPDPTNAEIVRVTGIATDTLTITRAQESTSARTVVVGDQVAATITAKTLTDVETASGCRARKNTAWSHNSSGSWLSAPLDTEDFDDGGYHDNATNNSRMTIPAGLGGLYVIEGGLTWAGTNATGQRDLQILVDGTTSLSQVTYEPEASIAIAQVVTAVTRLTGGQYVELQGFQTSTVTLSTVVHPHLAIARIGD